MAHIVPYRCLQVMGLPRKKNYAGRWDVLIDKSSKCLNRMLEIAARKKRNYIIDQVMYCGNECSGQIHTPQIFCVQEFWVTSISKDVVRLGLEGI